MWVFVDDKLINLFNKTAFSGIFVIKERVEAKAKILDNIQYIILIIISILIL